MQLGYVAGGLTTGNISLPGVGAGRQLLHQLLKHLTVSELEPFFSICQPRKHIHDHEMFFVLKAGPFPSHFARKRKLPTTCQMSPAAGWVSKQSLKESGWSPLYASSHWKRRNPQEGAEIEHRKKYFLELSRKSILLAMEREKETSKITTLQIKGANTSVFSFHPSAVFKMILTDYGEILHRESMKRVKVWFSPLLL